MGLAVAGFHRSGTSSVTQHLTQSGMSPGEDLMGANEYNPYGHFEDWGPVRFHDAVFRTSSLDWASVTYDDIPMTEADIDYIRDYCARRAKQTSTWCFKDPRICQFLKQWMESDTTLKALIVYRSPVECSWSIYRRSVREFVRGTHDKKIVSRIMTQPDHALALWVTHNRKLLEVIKQFPERSLVVGHAGFAAGFNVAAALHERFGFDLAPVDVGETFRDHAVTREVPPLPVSNGALRDEATKIWKQLQSHDVAGHAHSNIEDIPFCADPTGLLLANKLLSIEVVETKKLAQDQLAEAHRAFDVELSTVNKKMRAVHTVLKKLSRWPFSMFFRRSKKYRALIDEIMS